MERYENILKLEEIRKLVDINQYLKALEILNTIDIIKIKSLTDLSIIADVLIENGHYSEAIVVLNRIYSKSKARRILYQLVEVSIKQGNIDQAEDYLRQYIKLAPNDAYRYIFRYCIDKKGGKPLEVLISSLEKLKEYEYIESWAYELAKLYHKAGMKDKCIRECSDIVLWFGDGLYVEKARLLKAYYIGEFDPIRMLKAKEKKEAEIILGLDKTKDYSSIKSQIDQFLAEDEAKKFEEASRDNLEEVSQKTGQEINQKTEQEVTKKIVREVILEQDNEFNNFLDDSCKRLLGYQYILHKNQILKSLTKIIKDNTKSTYLSILGEKGVGKTTLAKSISKMLYESGYIANARVAKINGEKLNHINLEQKRSMLYDCTLIIEDAGLLKANTVIHLLQFMRDLNGHLFVVFEDSSVKINSLMNTYPDFLLLFKESIELSDYTNSELFDFASHYIESCDYQLSEEASKLLMKKINVILSGKEETGQIGSVMNFIKNIKVRADERNKRDLVKVIGERDISASDFLYIKAEDFNS